VGEQKCSPFLAISSSSAKPLIAPARTTMRFAHKAVQPMRLFNTGLLSNADRYLKDLCAPVSGPSLDHVVFRGLLALKTEQRVGGME
jgi:hypothetical protein